MISSTTTGDQRTFPLMSLNPLAPAFLPHYQFSSDQPISLCNSTAMCLPLAQLFCGMPPSITLSHAPPLRQRIAANTFILPLTQPQSPSKQDAEILQQSPGPSSFFPSPLQNQAQCLQAIHENIQQFHQHLKAEQLDRKAINVFVLQPQNDFAFLRYLLFSSAGTNPISDPAVKNYANSPLINPNPNFNPLPTALLLPWADKTQLRCSTLEGAVWPPRAKRNNSSNADPTPLQLRRRTPHQEPRSSKNYLQMKYQPIQLSLRQFTPNNFSCMIKSASLRRVIRTLSFGQFPQWSFGSTLQK